ncbi:MAG: DUF4097 family beta strand repeat-containing protein [Oscillospiraceae bacterium]
MNKNTKTALIVALSVFGAGVLIWLCVSMSVGFNYSKLSWNWGKDGGNSSSDDASFSAEHFDRDIDENGQTVILNLASADITVSPSEDGKLHLSYDNTENSRFEYVEKSDKITLTQKQRSDTIIGFLENNSEKLKVVLSLPAGREGELDINGASSDISLSDIDIKDEMKIYSVSGEIEISSCKAKILATGATSGNIELRTIDVSSIDADTVSGDIRLSDIGGKIPLTLATVSGEVYAEKVEAKDFSVETVSGKTTLKNVSGMKADFSSTSGGVGLNKANFREIKFSTISGDISGTVTGSSDDYTVYTDTVSGRNSLSGHRGRGERTLDFSSTSGSFDVSFEN